LLRKPNLFKSSSSKTSSLRSLKKSPCCASLHKKDQGQDQALFSRKKSVQVACSQLVVLNRQLSATRELATGSLSLGQG